VKNFKSHRKSPVKREDTIVTGEDVGFTVRREAASTLLRWHSPDYLTRVLLADGEIVAAPSEYPSHSTSSQGARLRHRQLDNNGPIRLSNSNHPRYAGR
jgi:hypothetical protein